jgi:anti-sigma-K factor RskA
MKALNMDTWNLVHAKDPNRLPRVVFLGIATIGAAALAAAAVISSDRSMLDNAPGTQAITTEPATMVVNQVALLVPDMNRASAIIRYNEDRTLLTIRLQNVATLNDSRYALWLVPKDDSWQRIGSLDNETEFRLSEPVASGSRIAVVVEAEGSIEPGPIALIGSLD